MAISPVWPINHLCGLERRPQERPFHFLRLASQTPTAPPTIASRNHTTAKPFAACGFRSHKLSLGLRLVAAQPSNPAHASRLASTNPRMQYPMVFIRYAIGKKRIFSALRRSDQTPKGMTKPKRVRKPDDRSVILLPFQRSIWSPPEPSEGA